MVHTRHSPPRTPFLHKLTFRQTCLDLMILILTITFVLSWLPDHAKPVDLDGCYIDRRDVSLKSRLRQQYKVFTPLTFLIATLTSLFSAMIFRILSTSSSPSTITSSHTQETHKASITHLAKVVTTRRGSNPISLAPHHRQHMSYMSVKFLWLYMFYLAMYFLVNALKSFINDHNCNKHANSVSGHFLFYVYTCFSLLYIQIQHTGAQSLSILSRIFYRRLTSTWDDTIFIIMWCIYVCFCINVLHDTYVWGFHSARQCAYGAALALGAQVFVADILDLYDYLTTPSRADVDTILTTSSLYPTLIKHPKDKKKRPTNGHMTHTGDSYLDHHTYSSYHRYLHRLLHICFSNSIDQHYQYKSPYTFPTIFIAIIQWLSFIAVVFSPAQLYSIPDVAACLVGWVILAVYHLYHHRQSASVTVKQV